MACWRSVTSVPAERDLPVAEALPRLRAALTEGRGVVLVAPPGAGKTTLVPLALLGEPWLAGRRIVMLEPRRVAARAAARRMAALLGEDDAGGTVGYRVRMDTRVSARTRIEVVTEGVLTRMLQSDPSLDGVGLLIFDEFHERSLHADLGLALALQARALLREDLRLLVMSATLDAAPVARLLDDAPIVESAGRAWPVETHWRRQAIDGWIEPAVAGAVRHALEHDEGDVLVFLPGAGEIRRTAQRLTEREERPLPPDVDVHLLFGELSGPEQDSAIAPAPAGSRKVVLATSIAETSLTIEGVRVVVDAGLMRVPRFDPNTGMTRLETLRVTRDAADQRRGRAGRTAPGVCYRLWTRDEERGLVPTRRPEILEADLAPLALELAAWGARPDALRWLDPPPRAAYAQALELLRELDAIEVRGAIEGPDARDAADAQAAITDHGRRMAALPLHPRLAHMLLRADQLGLATLGCDLAALLAGRDLLRAEGRAPDADLRLRVEAMRAARRGGRIDVDTIGGQRVDRGALSRAVKEARQHARAMGAASGTAARAFEQAGGDRVDDVAWTGLLAALAYPDRIAQARPDGRGRFLLRNGRGARFEELQPLASRPWLVAAELDGRGAEARIFRAAPLEQATVEKHFASQIEQVDEVVWDPSSERVVARRRRVLGALTLAEAPLAEPDPTAVARALTDAIADQGLRPLPWSKATRQLLERLAFLHALDPERWPDSSEATLVRTARDWLAPFLAGMKSLADAQRVDLQQALLTRVDWSARGELDRLAPSHVEVPSGSRIAVDYSDPHAPALAARIQEMFGMETTPRIGGGHVPLTVRLLSPAMRPVQVTTDLASFWRDAYFEVRKDLRGRYPKHYWPEDPLQAEATRGVRPKR